MSKKKSKRKTRKEKIAHQRRLADTLKKVKKKKQDAQDVKEIELLEKVSKVRPLRLVVDEQNVASATMFVRWCVDPQVIDSLKQSLVLGQTQILLIAASVEGTRDGRMLLRERKRMIAPLTDSGAYFMFNRPGPHKVFGVLIVPRDAGRVDWFSLRAIRRALNNSSDYEIINEDGVPLNEDGSLPLNYLLLRESNWCGANSIGGVAFSENRRDDPWFEPYYIDPFGEGVDEEDDIRSRRRASNEKPHRQYIDHQVTYLDMNMDKAFFAEKPWDYAWVNWGRESNPVDQCHFRRRRIWAYTGQPFVWLAINSVKFTKEAGFYALVMLVHIVAILVIKILFWARDPISWKAFFKGHLGEDGMEPLFSNILPKKGEDDERDNVERAWDSSVFISNKDGTPRSKWLKFISPLALVGVGIVAMLLFGIFKILREMLELYLALWIWQPEAMSGLHFVAMIGGAIWLYSKLRKVAEPPPWEHTVQKTYETPRMKAAAKALGCDTMPLEANISALPSEVVTLRMRFSQVKEKVCKPFAA